MPRPKLLLLLLLPLVPVLVADVVPLTFPNEEKEKIQLNLVYRKKEIHDYYHNYYADRWQMELGIIVSCLIVVVK